MKPILKLSSPHTRVHEWIHITFINIKGKLIKFISTFRPNISSKHNIDNAYC